MQKNKNSKFDKDTGRPTKTYKLVQLDERELEMLISKEFKAEVQELQSI